MRTRLYYAVSVCERVAGGHFVSRVDKMAASPRAQKCAFAQQKEYICIGIENKRSIASALLLLIPTQRVEGVTTTNDVVA